MKLDSSKDSSRNMDSKTTDKQREKDAKERQKQEKLRAESERKQREKEQKELEKREKKLFGKKSVPASATTSNFAPSSISPPQPAAQMPNSKSETFLSQPAAAKKASTATTVASSQKQLQVPKGRLRCQIIYLDESVKIFDVDVRAATAPNGDLDSFFSELWRRFCRNQRPVRTSWTW